MEKKNERVKEKNTERGIKEAEYDQARSHNRGGGGSTLHPFPFLDLILYLESHVLSCLVTNIIHFNG
jgi:hypothetical protein